MPRWARRNPAAPTGDAAFDMERRCCAIKQRIELLDAWRTLAIFCMLVYHFLYDLAVFGVLPWGRFYTTPLNLLQQFICWSFILLAGLSARLTRSNLRRGVITLLAGALVMAGSALAGLPILFGILQCLGCSMLLYGLGQKVFDRLHPAMGLLWFAMFWLTRYLTDLGYVESGWLFPLGFIREDFYSADYFGLLPWFFLFLTGSSLGTWLRNTLDAAAAAGRPGPGWTTLRIPALLTWPGRHSLIIYLLHQPVLYGLAWLLFGR